MSYGASFKDGLTNAGREQQSSGRGSANNQNQLPGFYTGIVMDDMDDQRMGQVWAYVGGISARRFTTEGTTPTYGGTVPDRDFPGALLKWDQELRLGWIQCWPMFPFFGGDEWRVKNSPDGDHRNALNGDIQTYGFWAQPRIGDRIGIMFANGDPAKAYWTGMIPNINRNFMVPGNPGRPPVDLDAKIDAADANNRNPSIHKLTKQLKDEAPAQSLVPSMDKARRISNDPNNPYERERENVLVSPKQAFNVQGAGLLCDVLRGAGNSSARRESPSYVMGIKSAGWNFDSEKKNLNTASGTKIRFMDDAAKSRYETVNTSGHQLTFDDHPDFQGIRLRTSNGHQVYMNDSCDDPSIYVSTGSGKVWVELTDSGKVNIFANDSISMHTRNDFNLTVDRDFNVDVQRDFKMTVKRNSEIAYKGQVDLEIGRNNILPQNLLYNTSPDWGDISSRKDMFIRNFGNVDWSIDDHLDITIGNDIPNIGAHQPGVGGFGIKVKEGDFDIDVKGQTQILTGTNYGVQATAGRIDLKSGSTMHHTSAGQMNYDSAANIVLTASPDIHLNGPAAVTADTVSTTAEAVEPTLTKLVQKGKAPTETEIKNCIIPSDTYNTLDDSTVPQHQPWGETCQTKRGFSGFADEGPIISRRAATTTNATRPMPKVQSDGAYTGNTFASTNPGEAPTYTKIRDAGIGELNPCSTYSASDRLVTFLASKEGQKQNAYIDAGRFAIGIGHQIVVGDTIFGDTINGVVTKEDLVRLRNSGGELHISLVEQLRIYKLDLVKFEKIVCKHVTTNITQHQFDAMVSFAYNTGGGNLKRMIDSSNFNSGNFDAVPETWMKYHKCTKCSPNTRAKIEGILASRRKQELEQFFAYAGGVINDDGTISIVQGLTGQA